jgi:2',3'-cyclic-nucleotide 2'-phosphodiesterase (5'-nucleotidase family)
MTSSARIFKSNLCIAFSIISLSLFIGSCGSAPSVSTTPNKASGVNELIHFNILAVNDVYEIAALENGTIGGMARVATLRDSLTKENPNTFLTMAGDFLNPSLLGTLKFEGERIKGKQMIEVMNAMKFDLATFGNHEFDLKPKEFQARLNESMFNWVSANVQYNGGDIVLPFSKEHYGIKYGIPQTTTLKIYNKDSIAMSLGFVSVTIDSNPQDWVDYGDYLTDASFAYNMIKDTTDVVIGFTHLSLAEDKELAKSLPQLPLIIGGHEHDAIDVTVGKTRITKADANAKSAYLHEFTYNTTTKAVTVVSTLIPINQDIPKDPYVQSIVDKWTAIQDAEIKKVIDNPYEVIYTTTEVLDCTDASGRSKQTNLGKLVAKAISFAYDDEVDAVFVNGGSFRIDDELEGDISSFDIFRVLPFGGNLLKVKIKGSLLNEVLDYGKQSAGTGAYLQRYNITQDVGTGNWLIKGRSINAEDSYWIATSDYLLKGFDVPMLKTGEPGVLEVITPKADTIAADIRKAVIAYLKSL